MARLFQQGYNDGEVIERLRTDTDRSEPLRRAAWQAVVQKMLEEEVRKLEGEDP